MLFPKNNLVLEIFGRYWHEMSVNKKKDFSKKKYLLKCGYKVEEIWDYEIKQKGINYVTGMNSLNVSLFTQLGFVESGEQKVDRRQFSSTRHTHSGFCWSGAGCVVPATQDNDATGAQ